LSVYKSFTHQHLGEITESVKSLQSDFKNDINFVPMRGDFARGIFASVYLKSNIDENLVKTYFKDYYKQSKFTTVSDKAIHLKQVVNTNFAIVNVEKYDDKIHITTAIDNLLKGASGQAVHNMNLMFGFAENEGLQLKAGLF
jgi:N-acetyl-gamma-glutamyl-phosphate reductase